MPLAAGKRNQRITFQARAAGVDAQGQSNGAWVNLATTPTVWASAKPVRGNEYFKAGQMQTNIEVVFNVRYRADITTHMRVLWRGVPYAIVSPPIDVNGALTDMELMCASGVGDGR